MLPAGLGDADSFHRQTHFDVEVLITVVVGDLSGLPGRLDGLRHHATAARADALVGQETGKVTVDHNRTGLRRGAVAAGRRCRRSQHNGHGQSGSGGQEDFAKFGHDVCFRLRASSPVGAYLPRRH